MKTVKFPYGRGSMDLHVEDDNLKAVLVNHIS